MVSNIMRKFNIPLQEHDSYQKWCVDVHNIASVRDLYWRIPLKFSEVFTQDISKFFFVYGRQYGTSIRKNHQRVHGNILGGCFF